jgi:hypothetical protein
MGGPARMNAVRRHVATNGTRSELLEHP